MTAISGDNFVNMPQYLKCKDHWDLPPWSSDEDSALPLHGAWVQFLVEELRSHMLHSPAPPPQKKNVKTLSLAAIQILGIYIEELVRKSSEQIS